MVTILVAFLFLLATSFFPYFGGGNFFSYLIVFTIAAIILLEIFIYNAGFWPSLAAGMLWDFFSSAFLGFYTLIFISGFLIFTYISRKYVGIPVKERI